MEAAAPPPPPGPAAASKRRRSKGERVGEDEPAAKQGRGAAGGGGDDEEEAYTASKGEFDDAQLAALRAELIKLELYEEAMALVVAWYTVWLTYLMVMAGDWQGPSRGAAPTKTATETMVRLSTKPTTEAAKAHAKIRTEGFGCTQFGFFGPATVHADLAGGTRVRVKVRVRVS